MTKTATISKLTPAKPVRRRINIRTPIGKRQTHYVNVVHEKDPKRVIMDQIGVIPEGLVQFSRILVAIYQPPIVKSTAGGIILTDSIADEDLQEYLHMGKAGLIVALGPNAYEDDDSTKFHGTKNNVGDWVWFRPSDGIGCDVNEVFCRVFSERDIIGKLPHPDMVW